MLESVFLTVNEWIAGGTMIAALGCLLWGMISVVFSPCHLASIPLIVAYVGGQQTILKPREAGFYSVAFTSGLFITIALIGIICALLGRMLGDVGNYWQILIGMVLVWGFLARGNDGLTLVMVAINSLTMLVLYGVLGGFLLGVGRLPVPWQALVLSIGIYVALPLVAGYISRKAIISSKGEQWFKEKFLHVLTPVTIIALLVTLVLLFSFKGEVIISNPLTILWVAIPLFIQTNLIFWIGYGLAKLLKLEYRDAAPAAMIGASNHFEVAIATSTMLFGLSSGAALATVVGVLIEVPVMLMLVEICLKTKRWFRYEAAAA